jgi:hypothetical protein
MLPLPTKVFQLLYKRKDKHYLFVCVGGGIES